MQHCARTARVSIDKLKRRVCRLCVLLSGVRPERRRRWLNAPLQPSDPSPLPSICELQLLLPAFCSLLPVCIPAAHCSLVCARARVCRCGDRLNGGRVNEARSAIIDQRPVDWTICRPFDRRLIGQRQQARMVMVITAANPCCHGEDLSRLMWSEGNGAAAEAALQLASPPASLRPFSARPLPATSL